MHRFAEQRRWHGFPARLDGRIADHAQLAIAAALVLLIRMPHDCGGL